MPRETPPHPAYGHLLLQALWVLMEKGNESPPELYLAAFQPWHAYRHANNQHHQLKAGQTLPDARRPKSKE